MVNLRILFTLLFLAYYVVSCQNSYGNEVPKQATVLDNAIVQLPNPIIKKKIPETTINNADPQEEFDWEKHQDSLRNILLNQCKNETLKNSFLQEFYLRGVIREKEGILKFKIPFDVHGNDCGAPDCYTTELQFEFVLDDSLVFPDTLNFSEHETGCVDQGYFIRNQFKMLECNTDHVIYQCAEKSRILVLYGIESEHQNALYFLNYTPADINPKKPFANYEANCDPGNGAVYISRKLTTNEYEHFLH